MLHIEKPFMYCMCKLAYLCFKGGEKARPPES